MPPKKKKGKGSKLARMSEDERLRYLQHRAELELEAKRRKQQLIAVFTKNKLKREEAFARLNTAKINEQWRFQLRQFKCKELHDDLEYLWKNFDRLVKNKDAVINHLYKELEKVEIDHRRLQEVHMEMIDWFIEQHRERLQKLHTKYVESVVMIDIGELDEMNRARGQLTDEYQHLESVVYAQNITVENKLMETRTRNAINTNTIKYLNIEGSHKLRQQAGGKINELWSTLNAIITGYHCVTESKKKQYIQLKEHDFNNKLHAARFPELQCRLLSNINILKRHNNTLVETTNQIISKLNNQLELLNGQVWKMRQEIQMNQTMDGIQLKRQSVTGGKVIKDLKQLKEKGLALLKLMKICSSFRPTFQPGKNYVLEGVISPYEKLEQFWEQYNLVKTENIFLKQEQVQLMVENNKFRHSLRSYLTTVAKIMNVNNKLDLFK